MDMQSLHFFVTVYKELSFSKAAKAAYVTQPVISRKIAALEEEFGCVFFRRTRQGVLPTVCGKRFFAYAEEMLRLYEEAGRSIAELAQLDEYTISVAAVMPATVSFLPRIISSFYMANPQAKLELDRYTPGEMRDVLAGKNYDFYITLVRDILAHKEMSYHLLRQDGIQLVTREEQRPSNDQEAAELLRSNTIFTVSRRDSPHFSQWVTALLDMLGVEQPRIREVSPIEQLDYHVMANMGVALSPAAYSRLQAGLSIYEIRSGPQMELGIAWREATPLMQSFLQLLAETLDDSVSEEGTAHA